ncbi:hypothetical protein [Streptomyces sp. NPDC000880]
MLVVRVPLIPDGATVEANTTPMAYLAERTKLYWVGGSVKSPPQYIALDLSYGWSPPRRRTSPRTQRSSIRGGRTRLSSTSSSSRCCGW